MQRGSDENCQIADSERQEGEEVDEDEEELDVEDEDTACLADRLAATIRIPLLVRLGPLPAAFPRPVPFSATASPRPLPLARLPAAPPRPRPLPREAREPLCARFRVAPLTWSAWSSNWPAWSSRGDHCATSSLATHFATANASRQETALKLFPIKSITSKRS